MGAVMDLKAYLSPMTKDERDAFAKRCGTSRGHLQNVSNGKTCGPALATALERETEGEVTRQEMRQEDYWLIWPDLIPPPPRKQQRQQARAA
jgi:DNA-binding transcriptional regulator YdaS (Cro superfamily)